MSETTPITVGGLRKIKAALDHLVKVERPRISKAIGTAREEGDLSENAEYHAAKEQQGMIEARIGRLQAAIASAHVVDPSSIRSERVLFGATVRVQDLESDEELEYQIVGEVEAEVDNGRISIKSPIARGLIGKTAGEIVDIETPGRVRSFEILDVTFR
ncbi:transcription elongation factor GreA [bacterium]|nr:transcription elongation factor GreA [bacterium]